MVNEKNMPPHEMFVGSFVYINSQTLPEISVPGHKDKVHWDALTCRTIFWRATQAHNNATRFPFSAPMVAWVMRSFYEYNQAIASANGKCIDASYWDCLDSTKMAPRNRVPHD